MLKIKFKSQYRKASTAAGRGRLTFVYTVAGTSKEVQAYSDTQGEYLREDDNGVPLFFSTRYYGATCDMLSNADESGFYPDTSELDQLAALAEQYGGAVGNAIAEKLANKLSARGANKPRTAPESSDSPASSKPGKPGKKKLGDLG
jgi:hypothetical protein